MPEPLRVLMIEDLEDDVVLVARALRASGFAPGIERIDTAEAMTSALGDPGWDIIIADYSLPRFSGLAALRLYQDSGIDIPFIIVSGNIGEEVAVQAMRAGAHDYVMKNNLPRLGAAVRRELHEAQVRQARREAEEENVKLYQETRRQASRLAALLEIASDISATLDLPTVLERIAAHARTLLDADDSDVYLVDPDSTTLRAIVSLGAFAEQTRAAPLQLGEGIVGSVAQSGVPEVIDDAGRDPRGVQVPGTPQESHALMCAPLMSRGQLMGAMALNRRGGRGGFEQADLDFLTTLARQAAIAIENARMYAAEQQRAKELRRALDQQRELDRLKDAFIQNVSHELRTPVTIIYGYADLFARGELGELKTDQQQPMAIIARRASALSDMVSDLTIILQAQMRELRGAEVDLGKLVHNVLGDFELASETAGLTLTADIEQDLPLLTGDPDHLHRMLDNLVDNAIKFTPSGGSVAVRLERDEDCLVLDVVDTGIGIPADQLGRVFERFYQVDGSTTRRYGGTGLGLALVWEIVMAHGGTVKLESKVDEGSAFRVTLPVNG